MFSDLPEVTQQNRVVNTLQGPVFSLNQNFWQSSGQGGPGGGDSSKGEHPGGPQEMFHLVEGRVSP